MGGVGLQAASVLAHGTVTITDVTFDHSTHDERAPGSDNFPMTWADDGHQYTSWGDGGGFGGTGSDGRVSLGFGRVEGGPFDYRTYNVWGGKNAEHDATFGGKSWGMLYVNDTLYAWVASPDDLPADIYFDQELMRLYKSTDKGHSWQRTSVEFWADEHDGAFTKGVMLNFGKAYASARDDYVYTYWVGEKAIGYGSSDKAYLVRVPDDRIESLAAYEYFAGFDNSGNPTWTSDIDGRQPVFEESNGVHWVFNVVYIAPLETYLLMTNLQEYDGQGPSSRTDLAFYQADEPWGPWSHVKTFADWRPPTSSDSNRYTFFYEIPAKWVSSDGKDFTFMFTGTGSNDSWNTMRGTFTVSGDATGGGRERH